MSTALIIISIAYVLTVVILVYDFRTNKRNMEERYKDELEYLNNSKMEAKMALNSAYHINGGMIRTLARCGILKEYVRYTELIEELGKYASEMYLYETPLFRLVKTVFSDENYQFPQLDEKQSKILWAFLKEIYDGKKPPEALLILV